MLSISLTVESEKKEMETKYNKHPPVITILESLERNMGLWLVA